MKTDIAILGAGITGLSLAHFLKKSGKNFFVLEKEAYAGGKIKTIEKDDYICECGPNTVQLQEEALYEIIEDLGLNDSIIYANKSLSNSRYVNTENGLFKLPGSSISLFRNSLLDSESKWKILKDLFSGTSYAKEGITVEDFFISKFGVTLTKNIIDPFVTGIYAGDISKMSFRYAFPKLYQADLEKGSLIRGLMGSRKSRPKNKGIFSFRNGLSELPKCIETEVQNELYLSSEIRKIEKLKNGNYKITYHFNSVEKELEAVQIFDTRSLNSVENSLNLEKYFSKVEYVPVISLHLGFKNEYLTNVPNGFGVLNSRASNKKYLGCIFNSDIFPHTAPSEHKLYTLLIGGARNPDYARNFNEGKMKEVIEDFCTTMKIDTDPEFIHYYSWPAAIPQYNIGHENIELDIYKFQNEFPNYNLIGNYFDGVSIGDCVKKGRLAASSIKDLG